MAVTNDVICLLTISNSNKVLSYLILSIVYCSIEIFRSYLSDKLQFVDFNGEMSTELQISTGVGLRTIIISYIS